MLERKSIYEENTMLGSSYRKSKKEGIKEGILKGSRENCLKNAKKMKEEKIPLETIIK